MASVSVRSYLAAGVAAVGVGAVALSPVQPVNSVALAPQHVSDLAVSLAAAVDPITAIANTLTGSLNNIGTLANNWASGIYVTGTIPAPAGQAGNRSGGYAFGSPFPILQQLVLNSVAYLGELPDIGTIAEQALGNISQFAGAPFEPGANKPGRALGLLPSNYMNQNVNAATYFKVAGIDASQRDVGALLPVIAEETYSALEPIINFATTPISGLLVGALGPVIGPALSVVNSVTAIVDALGESDFESALFELINIPTNAVNAFLNGGPTLDLTGLVGLLGLALPPEIESLGLKMGGLLSPGGVAFDALAAKATADIGLGPITVTVPGLPVGPIGAALGLTNYLATAIKVTPPAPTASVRAADADALPEAEVAEIATPVAEDEAPDAQIEVTSVTADEPVALAAERAETAPAPVQHRQSRRGAAAADSEKASPTRGSTGAKAASAVRSAR